MQQDLFETPIAVTGAARLGPAPEKFDFLGSLRLTLRFDQIVVVLIGLLAFYAVVYSAGVEKGRRISAAAAVLAVSESPQTPSAAPEGSVPLHPVETASVAKTVPAPDPLQPAGSYTIQMATYKTQTAADRQAARFGKMGHQAFVVLDGSLRLVCLDGFESRQQASKALLGLKTRGIVPRDAFVRPLPQ